MRTQVYPEIITLEQQIDQIDNLSDHQAHKEQILDLVKQLYTKLDNAEGYRNLTSKEIQARCDALVSICTGSGHSEPFEEDDRNSETDYIPPIKPVAPIINSTPCPDVDFNSFRKYLRICPLPKVEIPS